MNEGYTEPQKHEQNEVESAMMELTPNQEEQLERLFPEGPQTEEDRLLFNHILFELATNPDPEQVNVEEVRARFLEERNKALSQGGYDETKPYSVDNETGIVTPGTPLEQFKENQ